MLYYKPKDVSYTYMAMWIDANAYRKDRTIEEDELMFKYLYLLAHMFAFKDRLFHKSQEYDEFSIYYATNLFLRYQNKKQFINEEDESLNMKKIKSCANYMRKTIKLQRNSFLQQIYKQTGDVPPDEDDEEATCCTDSNGVFELILNQDQMLKCETYLYLEDIPHSLKTSLQTLPFNKNSSEWYNFYSSCLLTLIKQYTMCREDIRLLETTNSNQSIQNIIRRAYKLNLQENVVLFNLPESMRDYVIIQCQKFLLSVKRELEHIDAYQIDIKPIMLDVYNQVNNNLDATGSDKNE